MKPIEIIFYNGRPQLPITKKKKLSPEQLILKRFDEFCSKYLQVDGHGRFFFYGDLISFTQRWEDKFMWMPQYKDAERCAVIFVTQYSTFHAR